MNIINLMGRLTREPEIKVTNSDTNVARYTLAVNRPYTKNNVYVTDFIDCVCFGKTAEFAQKYLNKGQMIAVSGSLEINSYTSNDGTSRKSTSVKVDKHFFAGSKNEGSAPKAETVAEDDAPFGNLADNYSDDVLPF